MRFWISVLIAFIVVGCGPLPASTKVGPPGSEEGYYREGIFEVGLGRDYAVVDDHKVALTGSGGLADILKPTRFIKWQLTLRSDATGRDLIAAIKAGVSADFRDVFLKVAEVQIVVSFVYAKQTWGPVGPEHHLPAIILNIGKDGVRVTQHATEAFTLSTEDVHTKFEGAFDKLCKKYEYTCGNILVTVEDDAMRNSIVDVLTALGPRVGIVVGSTVDFAKSLASHPQASEAPQEPVKDSGRLPPAVIQRIVRQNYGRFQPCYQQGLTRNANLRGMVIARFVIERDGKVRRVEAMPRQTRKSSPRPDGLGTTMRDREVVDCVIEGYKKLKFPQPEGGIVTVVYPIMFSL